MQAGEAALPRVSVIVPNYNGARWLTTCLDSLLEQYYPNFEVLVVDNASSDDSHQIASSAGVGWIPAGKNLGFAGAVNLGLQHSQGELVALHNNDTAVDEHWLEQMVKTMQAAGSATGMIASKILRWDEPGIIDKAGHLIFWDGQNRGRGTGEPDDGRFDIEVETLFPDGCAALYRRAVLDEVGGFDEEFFAYGDDADVGMRARLKGWSCRYTPAALVRHRGASTVGRFSTQRLLLIERNRLWLAWKCFPPELLVVGPLFTSWRLLWNTVSALSDRGPAGRHRRQRSAADLLKALIQAYWQGLRGLPAVWRRRRQGWRARRINRLQFYRLLWAHRISARKLAMQD